MSHHRSVLVDLICSKLNAYKLLDYKLRLNGGFESDLIIEALVLREFEDFVNNTHAEGALRRLDLNGESDEDVDDQATEDDNKENKDASGEALLWRSDLFVQFHEFTHAKRLRDSLYRKRNLTSRLMKLLPE